MVGPGPFPGSVDDVAEALLAPLQRGATDELLPTQPAQRTAAETALRDALRLGVAGRLAGADVHAME